MDYDSKKMQRDIDAATTPDDIADIFARVEEDLCRRIVDGTVMRDVRDYYIMLHKNLKKFTAENKNRYPFKQANEKIKELLKKANETGISSETKRLLDKLDSTEPVGVGFAEINDRKMKALINATLKEIQKAETAILRKSNDAFRKIILDSQYKMNLGTTTYPEATSEAAKDFLNAGINCVEYKDGSVHSLEEYSRMALKTGNVRAYVTGEGAVRQAHKIYTVIVNKRTDACPRCMKYEGRVFIDDVWSGGPKTGISPETGNKYPLLSSAIVGGLYHPNCRDIHTTFFEGINTEPGPGRTKEELKEIEMKYKEEQRKKARRRYEKKKKLREELLPESEI